MSHRAALIASLTITLVVAVALIAGQGRLFGASSSGDVAPLETTATTTGPSDADPHVDPALPPDTNRPQVASRQREELIAASDQPDEVEATDSTATLGRASDERDDGHVYEEHDDENEHEGFGETGDD